MIIVSHHEPLYRLDCCSTSVANKTYRHLKHILALQYNAN